MTSRMCGSPYTRPTNEVVKCTYLTDDKHTEHSWEDLRREDYAASHGGQVKTDIHKMIEDITAGEYDAVMEDLLAALHGRKRAKRGIEHPYGREDC